MYSQKLPQAMSFEAAVSLQPVAARCHPLSLKIAQ